MKVLLVSHSSGLYGAQRSLLDLATTLQEQGVEVVVTLPDKGPLGDELHAKGVETRDFPIRNWLYSRGAYHWVRKYAICHREAKNAAVAWKNDGFDLIHTNTVVTPAGAMLAKRLNVPHLWHVREGMPPPRKNYFFLKYARVRRFIESTTAWMIGISDHSCRGMEVFCPPERIRRIYNGPIDAVHANAPIAQRAPLNRDREITLLCIGRGGANKGYRDAVQATTMLRQNGVAARLTVAGSIPEAEQNQLRQISGNEGKDIRFTGFVRDVGQLYDDSDLFLMTSQAEAFGRVTVEAMARGCIVVGTQSGGTPEIVQEGVTGLLYPPGDAWGLADRIGRLLDSPDDTEAMRLAAHRDAFDRFTRQRYGAEVRALYEETLSPT